MNLQDVQRFCQLQVFLACCGAVHYEIGQGSNAGIRELKGERRTVFQSSLEKWGIQA